MKHLRDLTVTEAQQFVDTQSFVISEKLDGSYFEFGYDELGFFSKTKAPKKYRLSSEYTQYYHNAFRAAHIVAERWYEHNEGYLIRSEPIQAEVFGTYMPNAVNYSIGFQLIITSDYPSWIFDVFRTSVNIAYQYSNDGKTIEELTEHQEWKVTVNRQQMFSVHSTSIDYIKRGLAKYKDLAELPLNRKLPDGILKEHVLEARFAFIHYISTAAQIIFNEVLQFPEFSKYDVSNPLPFEGVVLKYGPNRDKCVKIIHPEFKVYNTYYHIWQEKLIGADYSFKHFCGDKGHARMELDRLLAKYLNNPYTAEAVHQRTLLLFAEERKRLNGR